MKQYVILGISMTLLLIGGSLVIFSTTPSEISYKIGIVKWVSNGQYEQNIFAFKSIFEENGYLEGKNIEYLILNQCSVDGFFTISCCIALYT